MGRKFWIKDYFCHIMISNNSTFAAYCNVIVLCGALAKLAMGTGCAMQNIKLASR